MRAEATLRQTSRLRGDSSGLSVYIPRDLCRELGLSPRDTVALWSDGASILVVPAKQTRKKV